jgi:prophage regulatory protein
MDNHEQASAGKNLPVDRLLPIAAVQQQLGISRSTIYNLVAQGAIPRPVKLGQRNYFSERELQAWIRSKLACRSAEPEK